jgi:serine/threonine protein kinase
MNEFQSIFMSGKWSSEKQQTARFLIKEYMGFASREQRDAVQRQEIAILWHLHEERGIVHMLGFDLLSCRILLEEHLSSRMPVHLDQFLKRTGYDFGKVLMIVRDIACGVRALHHAGVVHLDLSASSVIIRMDKRNRYRAAISNLSACRILPDAPVLQQEPSSVNAEDVFSGRQWNVYFQAPELMFRRRDSAPVQPSRASNVFALGVLMNVVVNRQVPHLKLYNKK